MNLRVRSDRRGAVARQVGDIGAIDIGRDAINGRMLRLDRAAVPLKSVDDLSFMAGRHRNDDLMFARTTEALFDVSVRRLGRTNAADQDQESCKGERIHTASHVHGIYYSKLSAKGPPVSCTTQKSFGNSKIRRQPEI